MRYVGQAYELQIPIQGPLDPGAPARMVNEFHVMHQRVYGHSTPTRAVEFVNLRTLHAYSLPEPPLEAPTESPQASGLAKETRRVVFSEFPDGVETPIYSRSEVTAGSRLNGPAIVEQPDTTIIIYPNQVCTVDDAGTLLITS